MPPKALPWLEFIIGIRMDDNGFFAGTRLGIRKMGAHANPPTGINWQ
ncbi:MAG: hypothetical protein Q7T36_15865 [Fluviicoccus sp.]|nr:hypothetical protein [Fluviicoccus sp.]MDO8331942.1 hypothetical protein [Fluviicoccus sp.]